jgi:putative sugar O-methyltransferase
MTTEGNEAQVLSAMLEDMKSAPDAFRPTNFWSGGVPQLVADLNDDGFSAFRTLPSALSYFVPAYGEKFYLLNQDRIERLLGRLGKRRAASVTKAVSKSERALADYRLFLATTTNSALNLTSICESDAGGGERFEIRGKSFSRSMLNYLRALTLLERSVSVDDTQAWLEIGGGYGTLGEIVLKGRDDTFYVDVDIPPVAAVSTWYLKQVFGADAVLDYSKSREMESVDIDALRSRYRAIVLCPWQLPRVKGQVDVFANFMSFQEMEPDVVGNYIRLVQPLTRQYALMRNSAAGKKVAKQEGEHGVLDRVTTDFATTAFDAFESVARDSFLHGDESPNGKFRSEVNVLRRRLEGN